MKQVNYQDYKSGKMLDDKLAYQDYKSGIYRRRIAKRLGKILDVIDIDPIILFMVLYNNSKRWENPRDGFMFPAGRLSIPYTKQGMDEASGFFREQPLAPVLRDSRGYQRKPNQRSGSGLSFSPIGRSLLFFKPRTLVEPRGRMMKCTINAEELDMWGYDRDNGEGAAQRSVDEAREVQDGV